MANVQEHFVRVLVLMTKPVERIAGTVLARLNDDQYGQYVKAAENGLAPKCGDDLYCILDEVYTAFYDESKTSKKINSYESKYYRGGIGRK